jgi:serine/threonine protein phosphatase PrpC
MGPGRDVNADALAVELDGRSFAFAVADGVGSMPGSPVASEAAVKATAAWISKRGAIGEAALEELFADVSRQVDLALKASEFEGATTLVLAAVDRGIALVAAIGDSEALLVPDTGPAQRLNDPDHVPARPNVLLAWIDGQATFEPHIARLEPLPATLCLVTDGVTGTLGYDEIAAIVRSAPPSDAAVALTRAARAAGSSDDATAVVFSNRIEDERRSGFRRLFQSKRRREK